MKPCERLSRYQRRATPPEFARYLLYRVRELCGPGKVAVLWVERKSPYWRLWPEVELWGLGRNAFTYAGPHPVICHPPCAPWSKFKWKSKESKLHGAAAVAHVERWGGVIEQPFGSTLFRDLACPGNVEIIDQSFFGHKSQKKTILYFTKGRRV